MASFLQTDGILTAPQPHYKNWDLEGCSRWRYLRQLECDHNYHVSYNAVISWACEKDHEQDNIGTMTIKWNEPKQQARFGLHIRKYLLTI